MGADMSIFERERCVAVPCYAARAAEPLVVVGSEGVKLVYAAGTRFLDLTAQRGLLVGVELAAAPDEDPKVLEREVTGEYRRRAVIVGGSSGPHAVMVLRPPLSISLEAIRRGVEAAAASIAAL
jgi:4-aminobutyrate aminotransferase-like enzyme